LSPTIIEGEIVILGFLTAFGARLARRVLLFAEPHPRKRRGLKFDEKKPRPRSAI
jgi:hypothetical protein